MTAPDQGPSDTHANAFASAFAPAYLAALQRRGANRGLAVQRALLPLLQKARAMVQEGAAPSPAALGRAEPGQLATLRQELSTRAETAGQPDDHTDDQNVGTEHPFRTAAESPALAPMAAAADGELRALRRTGAAWAQMHVQQRLHQSWAKAPERAGPLNSHALALRTLQTLHALSPGYLLRFVQQMEGLFALEQLSLVHTPRAASGTQGASARTEADSTRLAIPTASPASGRKPVGAGKKSPNGQKRRASSSGTAGTLPPHSPR